MILSSNHFTQDTVAPLLVQLYDTHSLYKLAENKSPAARQELCAIVSNILTFSTEPSQRELIADILITLVRQAEKNLKQALADRLALMNDAPLRLVLHLTEEDVEIAKPILRYSQVLNDLDLLYIIQAHDSAYWQVIAARENLNPPVIDMLAETKDLDTARILAANEKAHLTEKSQAILADLACRDDDIARPLLHRPELPQAIASKLYSHVADDLKAFIKEHYAVQSPEVWATVNDVAREFTEVIPDSPLKPTPAMLKAAHLFAEKGQLSTKLMLDTLKRGQIKSFIAQFSKYCGLPVSVVIAILQQPQGQGLAILCRHHDIERDHFISMYLLTRRASRSDGIVDHRDLKSAITYFDRITKEMARRLLRGCH
jgi:uncharacterized protein (DUF2336 family)